MIRSRSFCSRSPVSDFSITFSSRLISSLTACHTDSHVEGLSAVHPHKGQTASAYKSEGPLADEWDLTLLRSSAKTGRSSKTDSSGNGSDPWVLRSAAAPPTDPGARVTKGIERSGLADSSHDTFSRS